MAHDEYDELEEVQEDLTFAVTDKFFICRNGKVKGPMDAEGIRKLIKTKRLKPRDEVSSSVDGPWDQLSRVYKDILSGSYLTEVTPQKVSKCDDCGGTVSMRAEHCPHCGAANSAADDNLDLEADWKGDDFNYVAAKLPPMKRKVKKPSKPLDGVECLGTEWHIARMAMYQKYRKNLHITAGVVLFIIVVGVPILWITGTDFWGGVYEDKPSASSKPNEQVASRSESRESAARGTVQKLVSGVANVTNALAGKKVKKVEIKAGDVTITDDVDGISHVKVECNNGLTIDADWKRNVLNEFGYDIYEPKVNKRSNKLTVMLLARSVIASYLNGEYD